MIILNDFRSSTKLANQFRTKIFKIIDPKFITYVYLLLHVYILCNPVRILTLSQNERGQSYEASNIDVD